MTGRTARGWAAALAAACLLGGCGMIFSESEAVKAFAQFQKLVHNGECPSLESLSSGAAREWVDQFCGGRASAASMVAEMSGTPAGAMLKVKRTVESEEKDGDTVKLVVLETVKSRPSNFVRPAPPRRYRATLQKQAGKWVLTEYSSEDAG